MTWMLTSIAFASACAAPTQASDVRTQYNSYADRSVAIVALAAADEEALLSDYIAPNATFTLGGGDVQVPLGTGVQGALALAEKLNAARYSYPGWDYMNYPQDVCQPTDVEIRFDTENGLSYSTVKFYFNGGKLVAANGWTRTLHTGQMSEVPATD